MCKHKETDPDVQFVDTNQDNRVCVPALIRKTSYPEISIIRLHVHVDACTNSLHKYMYTVDE